MHIRNAPASGMEQFGYGNGYKYPHDYENNYVQQQYLPNALIDKKYYIPGNNQIEQKLNSWLKWLKSKK